jgi:hypothetical protein
MRGWYLLPLVVALCPMCADSEGDEWSGVYDDYDCNSEPEGCECPPEVGNPCPTGSLPPPDAAPSSVPCEVGGHCRSDGEICDRLYDDPENPMCQLSQELHCVTRKWRENLGSITIYDNDPDCLQDAATRDAALRDASLDSEVPFVDSGDASPDASDATSDASD